MWVRDGQDPLFATMYEEFRNSDTPSQVHIDCTYRCDLDCEHCYLDDKEGWPEMKTSRLLALLDELAEVGVINLGWSGGEVFARPDFMTLLERASELGFLSRVKTHGGNLTRERVERLKALGVIEVHVSVYSLDDETHDAVTRVPGSLQRTLRGLRLCKEVGIATQVSVVIMRTNVHEVDDMFRYFRPIAHRVVMTTRIHDDHAASGQLEGLRLEGDELVAAMAARARHNVKDPHERLHRQMKTEGRTCGAATTSAYISADGSVWPCVVFPLELGNLHEATFGEIWHGSADRKAIAAFQQAQRTACHSCAANGVCFYCKADAYKHSGDFRTPAPHFHREAAAELKAMELLTGETLSAEAWATVPKPEDSRRKRKAIFPIYRPGRRAEATADQRASR